MHEPNYNAEQNHRDSLKNNVSFQLNKKEKCSQ